VEASTYFSGNFGIYLQKDVLPRNCHGCKRRSKMPNGGGGVYAV